MPQRKRRNGKGVTAIPRQMALGSQEVLHKAVAHKADIVAIDEKETGLRATLPPALSKRGCMYFTSRASGFERFGGILRMVGNQLTFLLANPPKNCRQSQMGYLKLFGGSALRSRGGRGTTAIPSATPSRRWCRPSCCTGSRSLSGGGEGGGFAAKNRREGLKHGSGRTSLSSHAVGLKVTISPRKK